MIKSIYETHIKLNQREGKIKILNVTPFQLSLFLHTSLSQGFDILLQLFDSHFARLARIQ